MTIKVDQRLGLACWFDKTQRIHGSVEKLEKKIKFKISSKQKFIEYSPLSSKYLKDITDKIKLNDGGVLIVDYGYIEKEMKDTMRRRKKEGSLKVVKLKRPTTKDSMIGYPLKEEIELDEETVFVVRFEKEGMRFATPFHDMKNAKAGEKILKKSSGVSNISITKEAPNYSR